MAEESAAARYARDWLGMSQGRKVRGFNLQSAERRAREYVNRATGVTTTATNDNTNPPNPN
jgi:hypothetical protein